jgi:hypothetical protein
MPAWGFTWSLFLLEANSELIFQAVGEIHNVDLLVRMPTAQPHLPLYLHLEAIQNTF